MLGHFLKDIELNGYTPALELRPGMAVVGIKDAQSLEAYGMTDTMKFAIVADDDTLIFQLCIGTKIEKCKFCIQALSTVAFKKEYGELYVYHMRGELPADQVLKEAKRRLTNYGDSRLESLRSYTGDDFVDECLLGHDIIDMVHGEPAAGQHWDVPLNIDVALIAQQLQAHPNLQRILQNQILNQTVHEGTHHGIALEAGQMLHFSTCRTPDGVNRLKLDPQAIFHGISHTARKGSSLSYSTESAEDRLRSRNRAIWWLFHADKWGKYCLFTNNCEHFSRYCREGKKESKQVTWAVVQFIISVAPAAIPQLRGIKLIVPIVTQIVRNRIIQRNNKTNNAQAAT